MAVQERTIRRWFRRGPLPLRRSSSWSVASGPEGDTFPRELTERTALEPRLEQGPALCFSTDLTLIMTQMLYLFGG